MSSDDQQKILSIIGLDGSYFDVINDLVSVHTSFAMPFKYDIKKILHGNLPSDSDISRIGEATPTPNMDNVQKHAALVDEVSSSNYKQILTMLRHILKGTWPQ